MSDKNRAQGAERSFFSTLAAIAWSFVGLRRKSDFERDVTALNPVYVIMAGLIGVALLIATLLSVVAFATR
ncbi:DUF2970 domain-containing protein [Massilia antarctica]|uniref:DUF2970 domain-containing protein n=1 Tax=Massilia antarctica TaxID=2765360 RepID=UPI0006BB5D4E|nr:DUF2970 domain-containing protein [Massilia sp. H27-R4]MCY0913802.1 DUF2970 domain-containing protein [Massilia sp. H27-R4]CUI04473.1 Probable transmembrane protein [Janthinobacterium sp. CG23_2]CUU28259.1 Probable transmembrane protein [Janthinobacterium sp. CG23_2]